MVETFYVLISLTLLIQGTSLTEMKVDCRAEELLVAFLCQDKVSHLPLHSTATLSRFLALFVSEAPIVYTDGRQQAHKALRCEQLWYALSYLYIYRICTLSKSFYINEILYVCIKNS